LRDDVAGDNVAGPDIIDKLIPTEYFAGMTGKEDQKID
jgi:hypothetical protein